MYKCDFCMGEKMEHQENCIDENPFNCFQWAISRRLRCNNIGDMVRCCETCREVKQKREEPM
ncbi:hypothetical protein ANCDUO_16774 [Ancylostoma duodenale]|uniref:Uncharacterized protein n=1 Tax=Ancylostoma duodenale TaxID=51022 RepID=A0A0C2C9Y6_9BILA|nr:hypothetical protein ANCDUO_16774 [Ancylostoma duodenale]